MAGDSNPETGQESPATHTASLQIGGCRPGIYLDGKHLDDYTDNELHEIMLAFMIAGTSSE